MSTTSERLEYLRGQLRAERISYAELAELQGLAPHIDPSDVELLEAAGVPESATEDAPTRRVVATGKVGPKFGAEVTFDHSGHVVSSWTSYRGNMRTALQMVFDCALAELPVTPWKEEQ